MSGSLPFTAEQFFAVFAAYNTATWPAPLIGYALGGAVVALVVAAWRGDVSPLAHRIAMGAVALMWLWTGVVYHAAFFSAVNPAAYAFATLFVVEAGALAVAARHLRFAHARLVDQIVGVFFIVYAMALYPLIGYLTGHAYPAAPVFGVAPCPVTIFTFGLLLQTNGRTPWLAVAPAFVWSLIGGSAAFLLGVAQDWVLLVSGLVTVVLFATRHRVPA